MLKTNRLNWFKLVILDDIFRTQFYNSQLTKKKKTALKKKTSLNGYLS